MVLFIVGLNRGGNYAQFMKIACTELTQDMEWNSFNNHELIWSDWFQNYNTNTNSIDSRYGYHRNYIYNDQDQTEVQMRSRCNTWPRNIIER